MRSIPLSVLGLVASVAVAGTPYSVARDGRGPTHHHVQGERGGQSAGHVLTQTPKSQSVQDDAEGSPRPDYFTLVSNWSGRDGLPDFSDSNRRGDDRFDGSSSNGASGSGGQGGAGDAGRSGGSDDGAQGWSDRFASFGSPSTGFGGVGGYSGPSQKPGQGSSGGAGNPGDGQGGDHHGDGGPSAPDGGAPQIIGKTALLVTPPPVPEPSTWMMMVMGVGFLGGMLRRGRARALVGLVGA